MHPKAPSIGIAMGELGANFNHLGISPRSAVEYD